MNDAYWKYVWPRRGSTAYESQFGHWSVRWCFLRGGSWWSGFFWWAQRSRWSLHYWPEL